MIFFLATSTMIPQQTVRISGSKKVKSCYYMTKNIKAKFEFVILSEKCYLATAKQFNYLTIHR
jgi:hypothetical protein